MKLTIHKWVCNVNAVTNPTPMSRFDKYKVKTKIEIGLNLNPNLAPSRMTAAAAAAAKTSLDVGHAGCRDVLKMAAEELHWEVTLNGGGGSRNISRYNEKCLDIFISKFLSSKCHWGFL